MMLTEYRLELVAGAVVDLGLVADTGCTVGLLGLAGKWFEISHSHTWLLAIALRSLLLIALLLIILLVVIWLPVLGSLTIRHNELHKED